MIYKYTESTIKANDRYISDLDLKECRLKITRKGYNSVIVELIGSKDGPLEFDDSIFNYVEPCHEEFNNELEELLK